MDIRVIGKIVLSNTQRNFLHSLGASYIADDNPPSRDDVHSIVNRIGQANVILVNISTPISAAVLNACPTLRFIQSWSTGTDHIDIVQAAKNGVTVKHVANYSTESVAETTMALMLMMVNRIPEAHKDTLKGNWNYTAFSGMELKGKKIGIVGMGLIGSRVAELARAFGMTILPVGSSANEAEWHNALSQADILTLHCPYNTQTHHLLGKKAFDSLKPGCYLVNNSRGGVVDESALLQALNNGTVAHASMDVFENEPPANDDPLLNHPRCYVTPHMAWNTREALHRLSQKCINNITEYVQQSS